MKKGSMNKVWGNLRRKISAFLIIVLIITSADYTVLFANDNKKSFTFENTQYIYAQELLVEDSVLDDGMFYIPHNKLQVQEKDAKNKYVFKVMRKGNAEKAEKVKLTMLDITAKYGRDYTVRVIDEVVNGENVQNAGVSKSVSELISTSDLQEYNYSDAIVDGSIKLDDILSEDDNYKMSEEEKTEALDNVANMLNEFGISGELDIIDAPNDSADDSKDEKTEPTKDEDETEKEDDTNATEAEGDEETTLAVATSREHEETTKNESKDETEETTTTKKQEESTKEKVEEKEEATNKTSEETEEETTEKVKEENNETVSGHTNTETEVTAKEQTSEETTKEETTKEETTTEEQTTTVEEKNSESKETLSEEQTTEETTKVTISSEEQTTTVATNELSSDNVGTSTDSSKESTNVEQTTLDSGKSTTKEVVGEENIVSTVSEIVYGTEEVQFVTKISTAPEISMADAYEQITGKKSDRKIVIPDRSVNDFVPNINSIDDIAYMQNSIKTIQEELKSAYIILEFKEGQNQKLIEINLNDDNKYSGTRQVGFNLSSEEGSAISGVYSSLTFMIEDDEAVEPTYINFLKANYEPNDGYITVTIERSGDLSSIATCMIDTEDITAKGNRDYSKVHAQLLFGLGANVRTVKIPIVSNYISDTATFKLKLQEPKGALIGDKGTTICTIKKSDKSFKYAKIANAKKESQESNQSNTTLFGSGDTNLNYSEVSVSGNSNSKLFGAGRDYDLDSTIVGEPIKLEKVIKNFKSKKANSSSNHYFFDEGKGFHMYLENHNVRGQSAYFEFDIDTADLGYRYDVAGLQFDWYCKNHNADITIKEKVDGESDRKLYDKEDDGFDRKTTNMMLKNKRFTQVHFWLRREGGCWGKSPTIDIYEVRPILRMYKINLYGSDVPQLLNDDGQMTSANKHAKYALTSIEGCKSDHTAVGWTGKTITVKLDNTVNNPFYIKKLWLKRSPTDPNPHLVTENYDTEATSISFKMDEKFSVDHKDYINFIGRPGDSVSKNGEFNLYAELGVKKSIVKVVKDERVDVKIWNTTAPSSSNETNDWEYRVGDVLHFDAQVNPAYEEIFECTGLNVFRVKPYSPEWITIRKPVTGENFFPLDCEYSEIRVVPLLSKKDNIITIRVPKDKLSLFDTTYGIFTGTRTESDDYYEYYIESENICGSYFDLKAKCLSETNVPVWYENNKENIKYAQNTYYLLGSAEAEDNIVYLTCEQADDKKYSIWGTAYYEEAPIGGKTVDRYWQVAPYVGILIDDYHFGCADENGYFETIPSQGKDGYYKKIKVVSNSYDRYVNVELNKNNQKTNQFVVDYEDGPATFTEEVYVVNAGEVLISNVTKEHPYITGVKSTNIDGASFGAVYINDAPTILIASVSPKKPDGSDYTYTYKEEDGTEVQAVEDVKRVEFVVVDMKSHGIKKVIVATQTNADYTEWKASYTFARGNYAEYESGDKLYARIVTNKKVGDGKGEDIEGSGTRKEIPIFNETTYQAIPTTLPFIEQAETEPYMVNIDLPDGGVPLALPLLGQMQCLMNMKGMSFGMTVDGDRIRLFFGKVITSKGSKFDSNGKAKYDNYSTEENAKFSKDEITEMATRIKFEGKKKLKTMGLGISSWGFQPIAGIYFEFIQTYNADSAVQIQFNFTGGGGYLGCIVDYSYTYYFLVAGVPCYVGGNLNLTLTTELGIAVDENKRIPLNDPDQDFFDGLFSNSHFEFLIRAILYATAYVGVGVCGCLGARGGFQLCLTFIWNPTIRWRYSNVRPVGFRVTGAIRIWVDLLFLTIPIPVYRWAEPDHVLNLGYYEDIDKIYDPAKYRNGLYGSDSSSLGELKAKPRFTGESKFVANDSGGGLYGGTYEQDGTRTLVEGVYESSEPQILKYAVNGFMNKALLVYLDDDPSQGDLDRTTLKYSLYNNTDYTWTEPRKVWEGSHTADFSPRLCEFDNGNILLAWAKRPDAVDENTPKADLLKKMEIYTAVFNHETEQFEEPIRMTMDDSYDYYPQLTRDSNTHQTYLYYLKNDNVGDVNNANDLLNNAQPEVNGAHLVYMLYGDANDGNGSRWLTDFYYDGELPSTASEAEKQEFKDRMRGQRIKDLSIDISGNNGNVNDPNISDYVIDEASSLVASNEEWEAFNVMYQAYKDNPSWDTMQDPIMWIYGHTKYYNACVYVVDDDGNINTKNDTEVYLKLKMASESEAQTIRLTNNSVPDMMPKMLKNYDNTYLFWIQNESAIKMVDLDSIVKKASDEDHANKQIEVGEISIMTTDKVIMSDKITNYTPFVDTSDNLYIAWQQDSNTNIGEIDYNAEMEFKQDLYVAGYVASTIDGEEVKTWTNPVRFTNNGKVNDLPAVVAFADELVLVNNQYNLKSSGDSYDITNSNLQEILYKRKGSLYLNSIINEVDTKNEDGSIKYKLVLGLQNEGLFVAEGYNYEGKITYDGIQVATFNGNTSDKVLPGNESRIGGYAYSEDASNTPIYYTLNADQVKHLDKVKVEITVEEHNVPGSLVTSSKDVFDAKESFEFAKIDGSTNEEGDSLTVDHVGDTFIIKGLLKNTGNTDTNGNEKIYVLDQNNWDVDVASSDYIDLPMGGQMQFEIPVDSSLLTELEGGIKDLVVYVKNDEGELLSTHDIATINARRPYNFKVNGNVNQIQVRVGEAINLNTTYEPSIKYKNPTMLYSVSDRDIAKVEDNKLFGLNEGTTKLSLATKEFGGSKEITVVVLPKVTPTPRPIPSYGPSNGGGGGGGGGGGLPNATNGANMVPAITEIDTPKITTPVVDENQVSWSYDPISNKFKLNVNMNGQDVPAKNIFVTIHEIDMQTGDGVNILREGQNTYYFDSNGNMTTGWVKTSDGKWYFFENQKNVNEGRMVIGWKQIGNDWYYFANDGAMLTNATTPDGYIVGADGKLIA